MTHVTVGNYAYMSDGREKWGTYEENIPRRLQQGDESPATDDDSKETG